MANTNFVFLIQGRLSELDNFAFLKNSNSKIITLCWDEPRINDSFEDHHFYLPQSTWAEGRNFLLEKALEIYPNLEYVIFMDGDLQIASGSVDEFIDFLIVYQPVLGLPLSNQLKETSRYLPESKVQTQVSFDQIMQAYSREAINDRICLPYITELDHLSWWYSCEINQYLTVKYYEKRTLQMNSFIIDNTHHTTEQTTLLGSRYVGGITKYGLKECKKIIEKNFGKQGTLIGSIFHPIYLPKPIAANLSIRRVIENRKDWSSREILRILYLSHAFIYARIIKLMFGEKYPVQTLMIRNGDQRSKGSIN